MINQSEGHSVKGTLRGHSHSEKVSPHQIFEAFSERKHSSPFTWLVNTVVLFSRDMQSISALCSLVSCLFITWFLQKVILELQNRKKKKERLSNSTIYWFSFFFLSYRGEKSILSRKRVLCRCTVNAFCWEGELIRKELEPSAWQIHDP